MNRTITPVNSDDQELKKDLVVSYISATSDDLPALEKYISYGSRMVRIVAWVVGFKSIEFQQSCQQDVEWKPVITWHQTPIWCKKLKA